jgi:hypothetical protein
LTGFRSCSVGLKVNGNRGQSQQKQPDFEQSGLFFRTPSCRKRKQKGHLRRIANGL